MPLHAPGSGGQGMMILEVVTLRNSKTVNPCSHIFLYLILSNLIFNRILVGSIAAETNPEGDLKVIMSPL